MPSTIRPFDSRCTDRADEAVTAAWRVTGFVTEVSSPNRSVAVAAKARHTYGSPDRFCESTTSIPSQPRASASRANAALRPGAATVAVQNSIDFAPTLHGTQASARRAYSVNRLATNVPQSRPRLRGAESLTLAHAPRPEPNALGCQGMGPSFEGPLRPS